jgi:hypothetical protein
VKRRTAESLLPAVFATAFGVLMVAAGVRPTAPWGLAAAVLALTALLAGVFFRPASILAVLLTIAGLALTDPAPLLAAVSGLSAAAYLVSRYADSAVTLTVPTVLGMLGFTAAGVVATVVPFQLTWAPLVAPAIMTAILIVVVAPLFAEVFPGPAADRQPPD